MMVIQWQRFGRLLNYNYSMLWSVYWLEFLGCTLRIDIA